MSNEQKALEITKTYFLLTKNNNKFENELEFTNEFISYYESILKVVNEVYKPKPQRIQVGYTKIV